jgi:DNA topoisomerase VI subunit B
MAEKPDAQSYFRSVSPISKAVTDTLSEMTGGSKYRKGMIDVNPSVVDFMIASYLPGFANEAYKGASLGVRAAKGEELKDAPLPLIGRFEARVPEGYDSGAFRRASTLVETTYKEYKMDPESRDRINQEFPSIGAAHAVISSTTQQIREIHQAMDNAERNQGYTGDERVERQNQLRKREKETYQRAVKRLSQLGGKYKDALIEAQ